MSDNGLYVVCAPLTLRLRSYALTRALIANLNAAGFRIVGLALGAAAGEAVVFEQAVKTGDAAVGDLAGTYPGPSVIALQGRPVANAAPGAGQVLSWDGIQWTPVTPSSGITDHGGLLGLVDDDHPQYVLADGVRGTTNGFAVKGVLDAPGERGAALEVGEVQLGPRPRRPAAPPARWHLHLRLRCAQGPCIHHRHRYPLHARRFRGTRHVRLRCVRERSR